MHQQKSLQKANQTLMLTSGTLLIVPVAAYLERHKGHRMTHEGKTKQNIKNMHVTTCKKSEDTSSATKRKAKAMLDICKTQQEHRVGCICVWGVGWAWTCTVV